MASDRLQPIPPFVWPESRVLAGLHRYAGQPLTALLEGATALWGVITNLDAQGVWWLEQRLSAVPELQCRLVLVLYPACATREQDLHQLLMLQAKFGQRVSFRLMITDSTWGMPGHALCLSLDAVPLLAYGSTPGLGVSRIGRAQGNLVFSPEPLLLDSFCSWLDWIWCYAVDLTERTAAIPALTPVAASRGATGLWQAYKNCCEVFAGEGPAVTVAVSYETGRVTATQEDSSAQPGSSAQPDSARTGSARPGSAPALPLVSHGTRPDALTVRLARLFKQGFQVAVDRSSRIRPLDAPIRAETFGMESWSRAGGITRKTEYRVSVLEKRDLRALESKRTAVSFLLDRMSYPLSIGVRWMPRRVWPMFEQELDRINQEGLKILNDLIQGDPDSFVRSKREEVRRDANRMYHEIDPGKSVSDAKIDEILEQLADRLKQAAAKRLLPLVTRMPMEFDPICRSAWVSPFGQAVTLLRGIAEFPRKIIADPYFLRGLGLPAEELLQAMDVCGDALMQDAQRRRDVRRAAYELTHIDQIYRTNIQPELKCEALLALVGGVDTGLIVPYLVQLDRSAAGEST